MVLVSHSMDEIARNVDRILVLKNAHILMEDPPAGLCQRRRAALRRAGRASGDAGGHGSAGQGLNVDPAVYTVEALGGAPGAAERRCGMLKDITLGQYFPGSTVAHRLDPRTKILLVVLYIVALFCAKGAVGYAVMALVLLTCARISR